MVYHTNIDDIVKGLGTPDYEILGIFVIQL